MNEDSRPPEALASDAAETPVSEGHQDEMGSAIPDDAFYSPDDPIARAEGDIPDDAIFSPDDPIYQEDPEEGVVTDMGGSTAQPLRATGLSWEMRKTADTLEALARDLKERGMEALRVHSDTETMDAMLRSYIAGYLIGRADEEE